MRADSARSRQWPSGPKLAILGHGRAGKDTAGGWLGLFTELRYVGSTSRVICPLIARERGISIREAWANRHNERMFWYEWANNYRKDDPAKIAKECLKEGDIVVGLRADYELEACRRADLFDLIVWVENPRVAPDPTVTFAAKDCDIVIVNDGDHSEFYGKLASLARFAGLTVHDWWTAWNGPTVDENGDWLGPLDNWDMSTGVLRRKEDPDNIQLARGRTARFPDEDTLRPEYDLSTLKRVSK